MNVKVILGKMGGSLGKPGSVSWKFEEIGVFVIDGKTEIVLDKGNEIEKINSVNAEEAELELIDNIYLSGHRRKRVHDAIDYNTNKLTLDSLSDYLREIRFDIDLPEHKTMKLGHTDHFITKILSAIEDNIRPNVLPIIRHKHSKQLYDYLTNIYNTDMSENERKFIIEYYWSEKKLSELQSLFGKSMRDIIKLKYDALKKLQKLREHYMY